MCTMFLHPVTFEKNIGWLMQSCLENKEWASSESMRPRCWVQFVYGSVTISLNQGYPLTLARQCSGGMVREYRCTGINPAPHQRSDSKWCWVDDISSQTDGVLTLRLEITWSNINQTSPVPPTIIPSNTPFSPKRQPFFFPPSDRVHIWKGWWITRF